MRRDFHLYRDPMSPSGVTVVDGPGRTLITDPSGLPEWRVEVHGFWSNDNAIFFIQGLELAAGNTVAYHRAVDSKEGNLVVVAFLTDDRPSCDTLEEAVRFVEHGSPREDGILIARATKASSDTHTRMRREQRLLAEEAISSLRAAGIEAEHAAFGTGVTVSLTAESPDGNPAFCSLIRDGEGWAPSLCLLCNESPFIGDNLDPRVVALLESMAADGWSMKDGDLNYPSVAVEALASLVTRADAFWAEATPLAVTIRCEHIAAAADQEKLRQREDTAQRNRAKRAAAKEGRPLVTVELISGEMRERGAAVALVQTTETGGRVGYKASRGDDNCVDDYAWELELSADAMGTLLQEAFRLCGRNKTSRHLYQLNRRLSWLGDDKFIIRAA